MTREKLLDERENLRIQVSLADEAGSDAKALHARLDAVDRELLRLARSAPEIAPKPRKRHSEE